MRLFPEKASENIVAAFAATMLGLFLAQDANGERLLICGT